QRRFRGTVFVIRSRSTSLTLSETGIAATAPTPRRALAITPSIVSRVTNGRAASWTSTTVACGGSAPRPARTDWARVAPPATSANRSPTSLPSHSGGRASTPAPASGRESPGEVTDAVHAHQIEAGQAHPRAGGQKHAAEPLAHRFAEASLDCRHGTDLAAQADLAEEHGVRRERSVVHARDQRRHDGEIGRGLEQPHPARHVH